MNYISSKNSVLSKKSQTQRSHMVQCNLYEISGIGQTIQIRSRLLVSEGGREEVMKSDFMDRRSSEVIKMF